MGFILTRNSGKDNNYGTFGTGLFENFDRMIDAAFDNNLDGFFVKPTRFSSTVSPSSTVTATDTEHRINIALPGVPKEAVTVNVDSGTLTVGYDGDGDDVDSSLAFSSSFRKSWTLPEGVDIDGIRASSLNGVLTVVIPKLETTNVAVRSITVE